VHSQVNQADSALTLPSAEILKLRYGLEERLTLVPALIFGLQHVLVVFAAMIAAPLVIGQILDLPPEIRSGMMSGVMLGSGIGTIISAIGLAWVGARLRVAPED